MQQTQTSPVVASGEAAGFGERLVAYIIDIVILAVPLAIMSYILPTMVYYILGLIFSIGYLVYFWSTTGQTVGKMAMGLKVINVNTGAPPDAATAALRYVGYIISGIPFYLGFFWVIWDEHKEGWHDKIAKTRVIKVAK